MKLIDPETKETFDLQAIRFVGQIGNIVGQLEVPSHNIPPNGKYIVKPLNVMIRTARVSPDNFIPFTLISPLGTDTVDHH